MMPDASTPLPRTIGGLKSFAKQIKAEYGCTHCHALEIAARMAGYRTYASARAAMTGTSGDRQ